MSDVALKAELRTKLGKGSARRARRAGKIPAVVYGHGQAPMHIELPYREYRHAIKHGLNTLISLSVGGKKRLVLTKDLQRDPLKRSIEHVDLIVVRRGEKVQVDVHLVLVGEPVKGSLINHELSNLTVEAPATHIPETLEVNIEAMEIGQHIAAKDVILPDDVTLVTDPEMNVVGIMQAPTAEQMEAELETPAEEAAPEEATEGEAEASEAATSEASAE